MPVLTATSSCHGKTPRRRRGGCDDECLQRIAARLCHLDQTCDKVKPAPRVDACCADTGPFPALDESVKTGGTASDTADSGCCKAAKQDSCCDAKATGEDLEASYKDKCCSSDLEASCEDKCCGGDFDEDLNDRSDCQDNCCAPSAKSITKVSNTCTSERAIESCCSKPAVGNSCSSDCCDDALSTADIASIEKGCMDDCCGQPIERDGQDVVSACSEHIKAAFARYEAVLRAGLCLCRKVQQQLGFCCCAVSPSGAVKASDQCRSHEVGSGERSKLAPCAKQTDAEVHDRCSATAKDDEKAHQSAIVTNSPATGDAEKESAREHISVRVAGMTCTGCSKKMMNVLGHVPGVHKPNVMFVSETAEWDLDSTASLPDVLRRIEKETGFSLTRVVGGYQHLDVFMSGATAAEIETAAIEGLVSVDRIKNGVYRLTYNPRVVGARSLLPSEHKLAPPVEDKGVEEGRRRLRNMAISFIAAAILTIPIVVLNWSPNSVPGQTKGIVSLVLATLVQAIAVPEFYTRALKALIYSRVLEMDMLVVVSITAAYLYSVIAFGLTTAGIQLEEGAFFETSSLLITLVLLGRLMSSVARLRAISAVSIRSLQADTALLIQADGLATPTDARLLEFGDTIRIAPHTRIVTDGKVMSGDSAVDESMITGESTLIRKEAGSEVIAGTINDAGTLDVKITRLIGENSITDISNLVENALGAKPRIQDLADRLSSYFVPVVLTVSLIIFVIWIAVALRIRNRDGGSAVGLAITYAVAALAVSCPCALGLAVPMVLVIAGGVAARSGVIVKAADALERGHKATDVVFDKTGTLTLGDLHVVHAEEIAESISANESRSLLKSLVDANEHPVSLALAKHLTAQALTIDELKAKQSIPGAGIQASWYGRNVRAGNPFWLGLEKHDVVADMLEQAMTLFCLAIDDELLLVYGLKSTVREEALPTIEELHNKGLTCHIVSGDAPKVVLDVASRLNIPFDKTLARSSPADKQRYVQALQDAGKRVIFVGDGTNDAVAVAQADVGMQIGSASDVTGAVADVVLLGGLEGVPRLLRISKRAFRRITFNFAWTVIYNVFAILMAAGAFVVFRIPPAYAGLGEIASVAPVIIAALSLTYERKAKH